MRNYSVGMNEAREIKNTRTIFRTRNEQGKKKKGKQP